jgi:hypothetical protein
MMRYLFIDNFRGFSNTYIPLVDVNFFVGENSSGKTSILSLLKLLSTNEFTWGQKFSTEDVNFGHFHDTVSAHSADRSYFSFGIIDDPAGTPHNTATAMLYTFKDHEGLARLCNFTSIVGRRQLFLRLDGKKTYFKSTAIPEDMTIDGLRNLTMPQWVEERKSDRADYREVSEPEDRYPSREQYPLYAPLMMALAQTHKQHGTTPDDHPLFYGRREIVWIAPIRTKARRTYDDISQGDFSSDGQHTPYLIRRASQTGTEGKKPFDAFMGRAGKSSGLFESIEIKKYGDDAAAPFEVDAVLDGKPLSLINVGYGVSQSLPVFVEIVTRPKGSWFAIQQPEVHLHPRAQASLGDAFFEMAAVDHKHFLIETHSDFTIDRFRMNYRRKAVRKPNSQVLFFERRNKRNTVTPLPITSAGELPSNQPDSYRKFFITEEMRVLDI